MKYSIGGYIEALKKVFVVIAVDYDDGDICMCWLKTNPTPSTFTVLIKIQKLLQSKGSHQQNEKTKYGMGENIHKPHVR